MKRLGWKPDMYQESQGCAVVPLLYADTESVISWTGYVVVVQAIF